MDKVEWPKLRYELKRAKKLAANYSVEEKAAVLEDVFNQMADGQVMKETLAFYGLDAGTVRRWISANDEWFYEYRKARLLMAQALAEEAIVLSRQCENKNVTRDKLQIDTLQWAATRMNPSEFGDRQQIQSDTNQTIEIKLIEEEPAVRKLAGKKVLTLKAAE